MTLLELIQDAALELKLSAPETVIGNSDGQVKLLLALAKKTLHRVRDAVAWPQLTKEITITLVDGQANYAFADDHDRQVFETHWDRSNHWELIGPLTPGQWQHIKSGVISTYPRKRYRIKGYADKQIYIDPTPSTGEAGNTLVFEYVSKTCIKPKTWTSGQTFLANSYCSYNGNIYSTSLGGVTGATPPTHTSSTASDDSVTWAYYSDPYETFLADTDEPLIDAELIKLGIEYRWLEINRFDYAEAKREFEAALKTRLVAIKGAPVLRLGGQTWAHRFIGPLDLPDTGYGS